MCMEEMEERWKQINDKEQKRNNNKRTDQSVGGTIKEIHKKIQIRLYPTKKGDIN